VASLFAVVLFADFAEMMSFPIVNVQVIFVIEPPVRAEETVRMEIMLVDVE
jgi:hypothetical protein